MNVLSNAPSPSFIQTCNPLDTAGQHFHLFHPSINTTTQFITAYYYGCHVSSLKKFSRTDPKNAL